jgi:hypothetical protein
MNSWLQSSLSRRHVLLSGAAAGATLLTPVAAQAAWAAAEGHGVSVLLHDRRVTPDAALMDRMRARQARLVVLREDPVRQWRDESAAWLAQRDARLLGITRWPDFLMLRGLAAESRLHVRFASAVSEAGVLTWLIA